MLERPKGKAMRVTKRGGKTIYGVDRGRGVYRDKNGALTFKATGPKRSKSSVKTKPQAPKPVGKNKGKGVYRDKGGVLTFKGRGRVK